jgi:hypothetical protein
MSVIFKPGEIEGIAEAMREIEVDTKKKLRKVRDYIGIRTIAHLRELINETRPPLRAGEPARKARQGHWADDSGNLARAYSWSPQEDGDSISLILENPMEYAAALDVKEGFFVLRGVADKGGPVEQALRAAVKEIEPEWDVYYE